MSQKGTVRAAAGLLLGAVCMSAQLQPPSWRQVGGYAVELRLAAPAGGPAAQVWFSPRGDRLYARTAAGAVFETRDYETWSPAASAVVPQEPGVSTAVARIPAERVRFLSQGADVYALGDHVFRSNDGGRSWANLTGFGSTSVIGQRQRSLAVSPRNPDEIVVANDAGLWRTVDGGLSWHGLNQGLPNFTPTRILALLKAGAPLRVVAGPLGPVEHVPGTSSAWQPAVDPALAAEQATLRRFSAALNSQITATARVGNAAYAGASDGSLRASLDGGLTWPGMHPGSGEPVTAIFVDAREPRVALAVAGGRVLRTTNNGAFWDNLTGDLPETTIFGITADRAASAVYIATAGGLFYGRVDLENPSLAAVSWTRVPGLPEVPVRDARIDEAGRQLFVALDGYGVYATPAPHRPTRPRLVNAADFSSRPAAPGSLLSVIGARVASAQAGALNFPVLAASDQESQLQVPFEANGPSVSLDIAADSGRYTYPLPVQAASPAIFIDDEGAPMLLDADTELMLDAGHSARSNSRIQILATGLGRVRPAWPAGLPAPLENVPVVTGRVAAYLDRVPVEVTRATLAPGYIGFYLIELQLPKIVNFGPAELYLTVDGQESNRVRVYLEP